MIGFTHYENLLFYILFAYSLHMLINGFGFGQSSSHNGLPAVIDRAENEGWGEHRLQALRDESGKVRKWAGKFKIVSYYDDAHFL